VSELDALEFALPPDAIAQEPIAPRDAARLLVLDRATGARHHARVRDLPDLLRPGDLLVRNATRVLAARLRGRRSSGGALEALLLAEGAHGRFRALVRGSGRLKIGEKLRFSRRDLAADAEVTELAADGTVELAFAAGVSPYALGEAPLPPYIRRSEPRADDDERYQTVYARVPGAVAAPTAGLHFTPELFAALAARGIASAEVILHVGPGTFRPVREEDLAANRLHAERYELPAAAAEAIVAARARGGRVVAIGTTSARVLEHAARDDGTVAPGAGETEILLRPGVRFRAVDALLTNFHLPRSSLLLLVAAFAGRNAVLDAYADALARGYRFYSYGDAMLLL
jgi:S-adenosylmethionine:tRNA ribosyltransferase-isomerase